MAVFSFATIFLVILGLIVLGLVILAIARLRVPRIGHATLTCPHCNAETKAGEPRCEQCGAEL